MLELTYEIHLQTPLHIGTGTGFAGFLDSIVTRDGRGNIYIPGSSVKGKARAAARRLAHALGQGTCPPGEPCGLASGAPCPVCQIFGSPQYPGGIYFDNVHLPDSYRQLLKELFEADPTSARRALTDRRSHVKLDRKRRSASTNHLFTNEIVKANLPLHGRISGGLTSGLADEDALARHALLWGALELITHMGRARSRGLGRCRIVVTGASHEDIPFERRDYLRHLHPAGATLLQEMDDNGTDEQRGQP